MTPLEIQNNKETFIDLCHKNIQRDGINNLLLYLEEKSDFYTAPSSTSFHLNEDGGLCKHSLNVFDTLCKLYTHVALPHINDKTSPFTKEISMESLAIVSLFHDLCKIKTYHKKEKFKKDENGHWIKYHGYEIKDDFPFGHGEKSVIMINWFMHLTSEEMLAIRWHMGMYDIGENGSQQRYAFYSASDKYLLVSLLQAADFLSSKLAEKISTH